MKAVVHNIKPSAFTTKGVKHYEALCEKCSHNEAIENFINLYSLVKIHYSTIKDNKKKTLKWKNPGILIIKRIINLIQPNINVIEAQRKRLQRCPLILDLEEVT